MPNMEERRVDAAATATVPIRTILEGEKDHSHDLIRPYERGFSLQTYSILRNPEDAEETV
ncbi:MAG TPA: hypothetical protein VND66_14715 [Acidobacteriaceae bacterium]|nr:hypothetical protein [Acidobacteriaceae bacterium]